jgi:predicted ATPase/DNA-binding NarL/FixJ family response regulator
VAALGTIFLVTMAGPTRRLGNLPAEATTFIGRRRELSAIREKLAGARLITLVGPGGVGKTRLAIRAATDLGRAFPGGAWLVELAEVRDPGLVGNAVMASLDLRDQTAMEPRALVLAHLRDKQLLLVVDNCEHLLEATARLVHDVITRAPGVRVIATSREPLSVPGEHLVAVPPLELPSPQSSAPLAQLRQNEAVLLFTERAVAASGQFELTASNRAAVVDLCRRLDGLPLAIELAAVRTRVLTVEQTRDRLTDRFTLLTGGGRVALPRHQTLQTAIDWSYQLLTPMEQALLRRFCVFAGRFTLEDAEAVCSSGDVLKSSALELLSSLVDKSLVVKEDIRGVACYRLHETMREYSGLKLDQAGEHDLTDARCLQHYEARCRQSAAEARSRIVDWLAWMDVEIDNIRSVLRQCLARGDLERGIGIAASLDWYWATRATTEGARWLDELLAAGQDRVEPHARAHFVRGFLAVLQSDPTVSRPALQRAAGAAMKSGQAALLSASLALMSVAENMAGDRTAAERSLREAGAVSDDGHEVAARLALLQAKALNGMFAGDLDAVMAASTEGARLSREVGDLYALDMMLMSQGGAALVAGDLEGSKPPYVEALRIARQIDDRVAQFYLLAAIGCVAAGSGQTRIAAQLLGAAEATRADAGASIIPFLAPLLDQAEETVIAELGKSRFEAEFEAGKQMSRPSAVALALGEPRHVRRGPAANGSTAPLAKREVQVARLVADGLTNKEIGARLFISENTVESHVRSILNKLGFSSRAQIAAWMASSIEP